MKRILVALALAPALAHAVPVGVLHQGRLLDAAGAPVSGSRALTVTLWNAESGGDPRWTGGATVTLQDGYYALALGTPPMAPLESTLLAGEDLWVQVDAGGALAPRQPLRSVPFALVAHSVDGGVVDASEVRVGGVTVIDPAGALVAPAGLEVVQASDPRVAWTPSAISALGATCVVGSWCDYGEKWGANRLATRGYYTECTGFDCSANRVELVLDDNTARTVLMSHLDWPNTTSFDVYLSFDGGGSYSFHKRVQTRRMLGSNPYTSQIRVLASNLPLGADVRVQVRGAQGRIHWEGFGLSPSVMPEEIDAACPIGTVQVTGYCIQPETTAAFGQTWTAAQDHCVAAGLRLCSVGEINAAIRYGALRTYNISTERNAWYISSDLAEDSPGATGYNQNCQPQGNTNEANYPLYSVQCQHPMQDTAAYRTTICCW